MLGPRLGFLIDVGIDFGSIFKDFGWILDGFGQDLRRIFGAFREIRLVEYMTFETLLASQRHSTLMK